MTAELLPMLGRATDATNALMPGAKWYFYDTGTTAPRSVFTTAELTVAHANPVVADSAGKFAPIYFDSEYLYRGVLTNASGTTTIFDIDPINSELASSLAAGDGTDLIGWSPVFGAPVIQRLLRSRVGEVISAKDYVVGDGNADDTQAYQELIFAQPAEIFYPEGCSIAVSAKVLWTGEMTHRFANDARIIGDHADYAVVGLGYPDLSSAAVTAPIAQDAVSFPFSGTLGLAAGDDFYLYDVVTAEYDVNVVRAVVGGVVYTKRPIIYNFATASNIRIYRLANACRNVTVFGGEFRNVSPDLAARGLGFQYATDIKVISATITQTGGNGLAFETSMRWLAKGVSAIETGAVGMGGRNVKDWRVLDFVGRFPGHDESLAFYKNCSFGTISGVDIEQYTKNHAPSGNAGQAGNCLLIDFNCSDISMTGLRLRGSATYPLFVTNGSRRISIDNFNIAMANLGGIRFGTGCIDNFAGRGRISDIIDTTDPEQGGIPTAAIQDESGTTGNVLGTNLTFARVAGGVSVRQRGTRGTVVSTGNSEHRGGIVSSTTTDWNGTSTGSRIGMTLAAPSGNTYGRLFAEISGGTDFGAVSVTARSAAPALTVQGEIGWSVPVADHKPYISWVDFSGTYHTGAAPLGAQSAAQPDSAASTITALRSDFNALLAKLRNAKLMA